MCPRLEKLKSRNILKRWGLTVEELTEIVNNNPSMRGLMLGYVAEYKLRKMFFEDSRIKDLAKDDDHDRSRKGDLRFTYKNHSFRVECKSLQTNTVRKEPTGFRASFQCDASDRRMVVFNNGTKKETTCLKVGEFDILAVNLFALEETWRFAFALNSDLPRSKYKKYTPYQRNELLASSMAITWPLNPPFVENPFVLLDQIIDGSR
jgi:hypothetical protein